jgi:hypothetical protein
MGKREGPKPAEGEDILTPADASGSRSLPTPRAAPPYPALGELGRPAA